ncbi:hypothetical protein GQ53DRAFT_163777 [Thozetella sp. PMI_491]|nr:hypothetical protein GQ53DRAFT_163777 [Thozetella sp. PMI_491]
MQQCSGEKKRMKGRTARSRCTPITKKLDFGPPSPLWAAVIASLISGHMTSILEWHQGGGAAWRSRCYLKLGRRQGYNGGTRHCITVLEPWNAEIMEVCVDADKQGKKPQSVVLLARHLDRLFQRSHHQDFFPPTPTFMHILRPPVTDRGRAIQAVVSARDLGQGSRARASMPRWPGDSGHEILGITTCADVAYYLGI